MASILEIYRKPYNMATGLPDPLSIAILIKFSFRPM